MEYNPDLPFYKRLHWQVLAAMILGSLLGVTFGEAGAEAIGWIGELFMRLLRMIIVPLVLTSIVSGVASVGGGRAVGRLFGKTLGYYVVSSFLAASVGLMMVNLIRPGVDSNIVEASTDPMLVDTPDSFIQLILDIVPINFVGAAGTGDMLAIIFFCIVFGAAITTLPERPRVIITDIFDAFFKAMMALTSGIIKLLPIGVLALITRMVGTTGFDAFGTLAKYIATLASGLTIHLFITLPLLLYFGGRLASGRPISPIIHFRNMLEPLLVAFSTSSSGATLPVTIKTVREKVGVSNKVSSFVLPMGATVNMDGTAVFECVVALFIAQALGADLSFMTQATVVMTALLASIGAAAVPSAGLVVIFIVLEAIGLGGNANAALIVGAMLAIDRPLDMARTAVNVYSDSCGAAIIARSEGEDHVDAQVAVG